MNHSSRSYDFLWLSLALLPLIAISFLLAVQPQDFWWVLRVGQDTVQNGAVPVIDTISLSQYGKPIVYQPWLAGVVFWLIYKLGGISLTFLLRAVLILVTYGLVWIMAREVSNSRLATVLVVVFGLASANNWSVRTQLFAYPLFVLCLWSLFRWQSGNNKYLWVLPLCTFLWANLHGSFILPLILAGTALLFGRGERRLMLIAFGIMLLSTLLNPRGFGVWQYFVFMLNSPSDQLFAFEWAPPTNEGWQMNIFFASMLTFGALAAYSPRKLSLMEWVWFIGFGWLALTGLRYVIWFLFIVTILIAALLAGWTKIETQPSLLRPAINYVTGVFIISLSLIFLPGLRSENLANQFPPIYEMETTPLAATEWLSHHPELHGPLWTEYAFGGYISFALQSRQPWMDSRFNAYPPKQWEEYVQVHRAEKWQEMFDRAGINLLMLSTSSQQKLIGAVSSSDVWCEEYRDDYAVIFSRCEARP